MNRAILIILGVMAALVVGVGVIVVVLVATGGDDDGTTQTEETPVDSVSTEGELRLIGGEPKTFKSFLALDMAVAVASGKPCLRQFAVSRPGRVLLFAAEDPQHVVRQRLEGSGSTRALRLESKVGLPARILGVRR